RYIDKTGYYKSNELQQNTAEVQLIGRIVHLRSVDQKKGSRLVADFSDETGKIELERIRGQKWIRENLKINTSYVIFGKANGFNGMFSMPHTEMELLEEHEKTLRTAMQPVYPSTEKLGRAGITNRVVNKLMQQLFIETGGKFYDTLPENIKADLKLISRAEAMFNIHFPKSQELLARAQFRLKFEELFYVQLQLLIKNMIHKQKIKGFVFDQI